MQQVVLVDERDREIGVMEKMEAHQKALLHRAFSVFVYNSKGEMLLQRRAPQKYHSGGLWTNACCSHPGPGDQIEQAAEKRLQEELGFSITLTKAFDFIYKVSFDNGLTEYEFDHVLTGIYDGDILPDPEEVADYCFLPVEDIQASFNAHPGQYTEWFKIAFHQLVSRMVGGTDGRGTSQE
jgi:isopentenyl-diphosphate delta-isomerase